MTTSGVSDLDAWYIGKEEPVRGYLLALRQLILDFDEEVSESWTHRMPMFRYRGKLFCYLWTDRKTGDPYLGIYRGLEVHHPRLVLGNRKKMKTIHFNATEQIPKVDIESILSQAKRLYQRVD